MFTAGTALVASAVCIACNLSATPTVRRRQGRIRMIRRWLGPAYGKGTRASPDVGASLAIVIGNLEGHHAPDGITWRTDAYRLYNCNSSRRSCRHWRKS